MSYFFVLLGPISTYYPVQVESILLTMLISFFLFCINNNGICEAEIDEDPTSNADILPLWSSIASLMILSRKILKRVKECRHPCRTPTVVLNQSRSPVLLLDKTALLALLYGILTCMVLVLMFYFLIVLQRALYKKKTVKSLLKIHEHMILNS